MFKDKYNLYRPSFAPCWMSCTASVPYITSLVDEGRLTVGALTRTSKFAREGIEAHRIAEDWLQQNGTCTEGFMSWARSYYPSAEGLEAIYQYLCYLEGLNCINYTAEASVEVGGLFKGTLDFVGWSVYPYHEKDSRCPTLHIVDFKFGKNVKVAAVNNMQLALYAIAYSGIGSRCSYVSLDFALHIVQPRYKRGIHYDTWKLSLSKLENIEKKIRDAVKNPDTFHASEGTCRWCPAKEHCEAHKEYKKNRYLEYL